MKVLNPVSSHKLNIPLCSICSRPLLIADKSIPVVSFFDTMLKREVGPVHLVCRDMQLYCIGMNSHVVSRENAEA